MTDMSNMATTGYQVVRQEFYNSQNEPQFTFNKGKAYINSYGLKMFPECDFIQILVNPDSHSLIVRPIKDKIKDSFAWVAGRKKRIPRHISCAPLFAMIYQLMGWKISARYRIIGTLQKSNNEEILYFNLDNAVCFVADENESGSGKPKIQEYYPKQWESSFGVEDEKYTNELITKYEDDSTFSIELPFNKKNMEKMYNQTMNIEKEENK